MSFTRFVFALLSCVLLFAPLSESAAGSCRESFVEREPTKREITNSREVTEINEALTRAFLRGNARLPQSNKGVVPFLVMEILTKGLPVNRIPARAPEGFLKTLGKAMDALHEKYGIPIDTDSLSPSQLKHSYVDGIGSALVLLLELRKFYENGKDPRVERFILKEDFPKHIVEISNPKYFNLAKKNIHDFLTSQKHREDVAELKEIIAFFKDIMTSEPIGRLSTYWRKTFSRQHEHEDYSEASFREKNAIAPVYITLYEGLREYFDFNKFNAMNLTSILLQTTAPYKVFPWFLDIMEKQPWTIEFNSALRRLKNKNPDRSLRDVYEKDFGVQERAALNQFYREIEKDLRRKFLGEKTE
jgi:hypothetical protein